MGQVLNGKNNKKGIVYLVGAGPGDEGLLTLRAAELLEGADVVVYDRLVNPVLLERARHAKKIYVGKDIAKKSSPDTGCVGQAKINRLLAKLAWEGKRVVRLKGGDPFIFGRGAEEASFLKREGIPYEIVPGVSAGYAVPAYAGIPLTDRRLASLVTFVTAHEQDQRSEIRWDHLAKLRGTLVFFMGVRNLSLIVKRLTKKGMSRRTPATVIEWGTWPKQRVIEGTLDNIVRRTREAKIESPALSVVGEVNRLRKELDWFRSDFISHPEARRAEGSQSEMLRSAQHDKTYETASRVSDAEEKRPLFGKKILLTRAQAQAGSLKEALERKGAMVLEYPVIEILPPSNWARLDKALKEIAQFDWIVFTSVNSVRSVFSRLKIQGKDARVLAGLKIAAVGEATRDALFQNGLRPDLIPARFTTEELLRKFEAVKGIRGSRILLPRTDIAPEALNKGLEKLGAKVTQVVAYRTAPVGNTEEKEKIKKWLRRGEIDFVTFTSSSTVKNFFEGFPKHQRSRFQTRWISIGPVTSRTLRDYGQAPYREARDHTARGLVEALARESG